MVTPDTIPAVSAATALPVMQVPDTDVKQWLAGHRSARKHEVHGVVLLSGAVVPQLRRETCADCRNADGDAKHSPDAADAAALALYAAAQ